MKNIHNELTDKFFKVIVNLDTPDECRRFFEDICTIKEIQDMSQRLEVAFLLDNGKSYQEVLSKTGVSTATISRVNKCLNYGSGGYKAAIEKYSEIEEK
ncbi:MAG: TrpR-like protein YerC/YecD [Ruminococcaceae bacterium]|nr:TrpR-like protein YerC/YecD [Oscillospiraceae bacterium]